MPGVRFEPTIPVFEPTETVHALDHAATVIGRLWCDFVNNASEFTPHQGNSQYTLYYQRFEHKIS
jgi:hypothetical protein